LPIVWIEPVVLRRRIHTTNISITASAAKAKTMLDIVRMHHRRALQRQQSRQDGVSDESAP
jgi:hypothetical protein